MQQGAAPTSRRSTGPAGRDQAGAGGRRTPPNASGRSARPRLAPAGARIGPISLAALVAWQVVIALLLFGLRDPGWILIVALLALVLVAAVTLVPWHGRLLGHWLGVWSGFRRRADAAGSAPYDPMLGPLREWLPELTVTSTASRTGTPIGVVYDGSGYSAVLAPEIEDLITATGPAPIPLQALAGLGSMDRIRFTSVQFVVRTTPAPVPRLRAYAGQLATSYDEINSVGAPAMSSWWLGLRYDPSVAVGALGVGADDTEAVARELRSSVTWTSSVLSSSGLPCRPLDEPGVREVLALTSGAQVDAAPPHGVRRTSETWSVWTGDQMSHVTGWVRDWPSDGLAGMTRLLGALAAAPADSATAALTFSWPAGRAMRVSAYVRVSARDVEDARKAFGVVQRTARTFGCRVIRLDGEHLRGLLATIPFGGGDA